MVFIHKAFNSVSKTNISIALLFSVLMVTKATVVWKHQRMLAVYDVVLGGHRHSCVQRSGISDVGTKGVRLVYNGIMYDFLY